MIARVSNLRLDPAQIDDGVRRVRDGLVPAIARLAGFERAWWMVSPGSGDVLAVTAWTDEDSMYAAASSLAGVRDEVVGELHATPRATQIHALQCVVSSTEVPSGDTWTRVLRLSGPTDDAARSRRFFVASAGHLGVEPGFVTDWWSIDPASGTGLRMTAWADRDEALAAEANDALVGRALSEATGWTVVDADVYRTVMASVTQAPSDDGTTVQSSSSS